ncbi:hypothetical protein [Dietzia natronolimnaea]|uniref:hypothetical protein n=1 Tax=Dietzia natronolimnaea TaxID=161920 RepID=UPI0031F8F71E
MSPDSGCARSVRCVGLVTLLGAPGVFLDRTAILALRRDSAGGFGADDLGPQS